MLHLRAMPPAFRELYTAWATHVARPGNWFDGRERVAFVHAVWAALDDDAPPPPWSPGQAGPLGEVAHRVGRYASTCTQRWYRTIVEGLDGGAPAYVELVGLAATAAAVDGMARALGVSRPRVGEPSGVSPRRVAIDVVEAELNWVPVVPPADADAAVVQALSAAPDELAMAWRFAAAQYIPLDEMVDENWQRGVLHRRQIELVAARLSLRRECFY